MKIRKNSKKPNPIPSIRPHSDMSQDPEIQKIISTLPFTINEYLFEQVIGTGSFGVVFKVYHYGYKRVFAGKMLFAKEEKASSNSIESEINILIQLMHPNIIKIYEYFEYKNRLVMIFQFCSNGTLKNLIQPGVGIQRDLINPFIKQIVEALAYLHDNQIAHLDIKTTNVFVDNFMRPLLADFGLSCHIEGVEQMNSFSGSFVYRSPEMIQQLPYDPYKADVWALGVTFFMMVTGNSPWQMFNAQVMKNSIINGQFDMPQNVDPDVAAMIRMMLTVDPIMRPSIAEIARLPFIQKIKANEQSKNGKHNPGISHQISQNKCLRLLSIPKPKHYSTSSIDVFSTVPKTMV